MTPLAAPADKRFRRAHLKPGRRRGDWKAVAGRTVRFALTASALVYCLYRMAGIVAQAHALRIERIAVRGNERLSKNEVLATLNGLVGESLVWTDLDVWRQRLLKSPWVRDAAMRRALPSTVEVVVAERLPIAVGRIHGELYLIDEGGVIIDRYGPQYADFDLPIVDGLSVAPGSDGSIADAPRAELAARLIAALGAKPQIASRLSQVDVSDVHNASVILNGDTAVIQLGDDQFLTRLESYLDLAAALRERVADIDYVDLRFDDRIYVRPTAAPSALRRGKPAPKAGERR
jgi:cell division protein FtsQ